MDSSHSSILVGEIPWREEWQTTVHGVAESDMTQWLKNNKQSEILISTCSYSCKMTIHIPAVYPCFRSQERGKSKGCIFCLLKEASLKKNCLIIFGWPELTSYSEWCQIRDLRRRFSFGTRDQAWSLKSFCEAEFYWSEKGTEEASDIDIRRTESDPRASFSKLFNVCWKVINQIITWRLKEFHQALLPQYAFLR